MAHFGLRMREGEAIRWSRGGRLLGRVAQEGKRRRRSDPVETLRRRLASGEIGVEEYRERLALLEGGPPS